LAHLEQSRLVKLAMTSEKGPHAMVRLIARVVGVGVETADMLVNEVFSRHLRDRKAVARYAGLTGSPDESGKRRRERGLARAGNARVRCGMIQLAWRFLRFQKDSALAQWFQARTADGRGNTRKTEAIATGINVHRVSAVAFGIGLGLAAAAGVFAPFMLGSITPAMGAEVTVTSFAVIVIGSLGNPLGTVLGGMVMQSYYSSWANLLPYVPLIAILLARPSGLLGRRVRRITRLIHPKF
jgi:hypothetical protein